MKVHYNSREGQCTPEYFKTRGTEDAVFIVDENNRDIAIALGLENAKLIADAINSYASCEKITSIVETPQPRMVSKGLGSR